MRSFNQLRSAVCTQQKLGGGQNFPDKFLFEKLSHIGHFLELQTLEKLEKEEICVKMAE